MGYSERMKAREGYSERERERERERKRERETDREEERICLGMKVREAFVFT